MMEKAEVPSGWVYATIRDVVASDGVFTDGDWVETKDQDPNGGVRLIQLADLGDGSFLDKSSRFLTRAKAYELNCTFLAKGDLLVARMPDPLGRCCIFPLDGVEKYVTVVDVCAVRLGTSPITPKYMMYLINSPRTRANIEALKSGSTRKRISRGNFASVEIPLAPQNEQNRIIAKIQELFSELDKGVESLKTARGQLNVYRQAVLKHAFEGMLTAQWREENEDKLETPEQLLARIKRERETRYERQLKEWKAAVKIWQECGKSGQKPRKPKTPVTLFLPRKGEIANLPSLPNSWLWIKVQALLAEPLANGHSVKDRASGFPVLRLTAIKTEKLDLSEAKNGDWEYEDALSYLVQQGDFLLARGNGSKRLVGRGGVVPAVERDVAYPDTMIRLRLDPKVVDGSFFSYVWNSRLLREQIEGTARTTAGIYKINQGHILDFMVPLCSLSEQEVVVERLSVILSTIDAMEATIDNQLLKADALRQSVLKGAFAGQLVAQDSSDEPASVLLDQIKAERKEASKGRETTKRTRKKRKPAA